MTKLSLKDSFKILHYFLPPASESTRSLLLMSVIASILRKKDSKSWDALTNIQACVSELWLKRLLMQLELNLGQPYILIMKHGTKLITDNKAEEHYTNLKQMALPIPCIISAKTESNSKINCLFALVITHLFWCPWIGFASHTTAFKQELLLLSFLVLS